MNAKELRIENFVYNSASGSVEVCKVESITKLGIAYDSESRNGTCSIDNVKPIPLTEEWLRKFNAESYFNSDPQETQASKVFKFGDVKIHMCNEDVEEFMFESFEFIKIKTVHQFQNLYFALTGTELTYETKTEYLP